MAINKAASEGAVTRARTRGRRRYRGRPAVSPAFLRCSQREASSLAPSPSFYFLFVPQQASILPLLPQECVSLLSSREFLSLTRRQAARVYLCAMPHHQAALLSFCLFFAVLSYCLPLLLSCALSLWHVRPLLFAYDRWLSF